MENITPRDLFAAHAPAHIPDWFAPVFDEPSPEVPFGFDGSKDREYHAWLLRRDKARMAQWPWAWADLMMKGRA